MVFVEYEGEVEEESARVKALLEKLRIEAQVLVFWLAAGHLSTYERIVNGITDNTETEIMVNDALRHEEWWDELQDFRGRSGPRGSSRETSQPTHWTDLAVGRPGVYNPHQESGSDRRRQSVTDVAEMPKRPDIAMLGKWGVNVGIHTHHLPEDVLHEPGLEDALCTITEHSDSDSEYDLDRLDREDHAAQGALEFENLAKLPLLTRGRQPATGSSSVRVGRGRQNKSFPIGTLQPPAYGSLSTPQNPTGKREGVTSQHIPELTETGASPPPQAGQDARRATEPFPSLQPSAVPEPFPTSPGRSRSVSPARVPRSRRNSKDELFTPVRPSFSRQSSASRFSSRPVPETRVTAEAEGSKLSFAPAAGSPTLTRTERPSHSRQSSWSKLPSKPFPEAQVEDDDLALGTSQVLERVPEASIHSPCHSRRHSRQDSQRSVIGQGDVSLSIPELCDSYRNETVGGNDLGAGSTYSTQSAAFSFNDLPSRAQHLIINELMRQHSRDTAVLMSTLPIPSEGTSRDETATIRYLSDVEILCHELPPTMMFLSNNMTVTVSL